MDTSFITHFFPLHHTQQFQKQQWPSLALEITESCSWGIYLPLTLGSGGGAILCGSLQEPLGCSLSPVA
jgi:hypothetical protein